MFSCRLRQFLVITVGIVAPWSYADLQSEACQVVEIDSAGRYMMKSSKIRQIGTTHNREGVAMLVSIWPPSENSDSDIEEIDIMASVTPGEGPDCRRGLPHPREDIVVCFENIPGFPGLEGSVRFKMGRGERFEERTEQLIKYLKNEVLNCETSGQRI